MTTRWRPCLTLALSMWLALVPQWTMAQSRANNPPAAADPATSNVTGPQSNSDSGPSRDPGYHLRDGLYFRFALGGGYVHDRISNDVVGKATISGAAIPFDLMLGWTVVQGLALGAGVWLAPMSNPTGEYQGNSTSISSKYRVQYSRLGVFADYYPNPREGLHVLGNIAHAGMTIVQDATDKLLANAKGVAFTAGVGYEFWIASQWSAGLLAQVGYAALSAPHESHGVIAPALMATLTCQ
jgi:hypothetical protein